MDLAQLANIDLVQELGLENLPQEEQERILMEIGEVIQQRIILRLVEEMSEETVSEFNQLLEESEKNNTPEKVGQFLNEKFPNLEQMVNEEVGTYKGELLDLIDGLKEEQ